MDQRQDAGSVYVGLWGDGLAIFAAFFLAFVPNTRMAHPTIAYVAGLAVLTGGGLLRHHCFRVLGARFTYVVQVASGQPVIERGAYRLMRHPSYTAGMMEFVGIGLALGNWASLLVTATIPALVIAYRVHIEERALVATLGEPYREYMRRTRRFVPFLF